MSMNRHRSRNKSRGRNKNRSSRCKSRKNRNIIWRRADKYIIRGKSVKTKSHSSAYPFLSIGMHRGFGQFDFNKVGFLKHTNIHTSRKS